MSLTSPNDARVAHHYADVGDVLLHYVTAGDGFPVVMIHGYPQTWWEWRHQIPVLAEKYSVITPDMRGLGDSSRPISGYDKKTISDDIWRVVNSELGHESFYLVGHDWGGPTAYALAAAHPEAVKRLVIIDVPIPGCGGDFSQGGRRWHHQFHMTLDLPEALTAGREDIYLSWFYRTFAYRPDAIDQTDLKEYVRTYSQPGAMRAGFNLYRAAVQDVEDNQANIARQKLAMPVLTISGGKSYPHARGRISETEDSLKRVATNVRGEIASESGHFVPEEAPDFLNERLLSFFAEDD
ncbi:MAG: alpha/beta hydrolase [Rhodospirillaceae bacterium]|nr:alpha/beta hydrolase [Rhodospirillaceae bacterium]|tara:strand:+ start:83595 stop:84479 length:885 start_codon:yes stop_codon:yes gene_type:complete